MQKIYKTNFANETLVATSEKVGTIDDFIQFTVDDVLIHHHKKNSQTTYFHLSGSNEMEKILFLVTQDKNLINELDMLQPNREKTLDMLSSVQLNDFVSITMQKLLQSIEKHQGDYELDINGHEYSFRLIKGIKCRNLLEKIDNYMEKCENLKEYAGIGLKL